MEKRYIHIYTVPTGLTKVSAGRFTPKGYSGTHSMALLRGGSGTMELLGTHGLVIIFWDGTPVGQIWNGYLSAVHVLMSRQEETMIGTQDLPPMELRPSEVGT